jgi:KIF-binding protein
VFLSAQTWLNKAKEYYTSENEASKYAINVPDLAALYKYLAFFDDDEDNLCKLHKRRADLLEELVMNICRECWYELGLTYATMLDIKMTKLENLSINEKPRVSSRLPIRIATRRQCSFQTRSVTRR